MADEDALVDLIRARYCIDKGNGPSAVLMPQVRDAAGHDTKRKCDALVMKLYPSLGLHLEGFEIKCSRGDWLTELRDPDKANAFAQFCDRWWLVLDDETHIKSGELPEGWGLLARRGAQLHLVHRAPLRDAPECLPKTLLASVFRQADREFYRGRA